MSSASASPGAYAVTSLECRPINNYTYLMNIESKSSDKELHIRNQPKWGVKNILAALHRWTCRSIKHEDRGSRNIEKSAEPEEQPSKLWVLSLLCVKTRFTITSRCYTGVNPDAIVHVQVRQLASMQSITQATT